LVLAESLESLASVHIFRSYNRLLDFQTFV